MLVTASAIEKLKKKKKFSLLQGVIMMTVNLHMLEKKELQGLITSSLPSFKHTLKNCGHSKAECEMGENELFSSEKTLLLLLLLFVFKAK